MQLGVVCPLDPCGYYRAILPMRAMESRGHTVIGPKPDGRIDVGGLRECDVVHACRVIDESLQDELADLAGRGVAITYDNDDYIAALPKESPDYERFGPAEARRRHALTVRMARLADVFTTTNAALADLYRKAGVGRVEVIGNYLGPDRVHPPAPHDGLVVGWVAGPEHEADAARIPIADALQRLLAIHPNVRVESIGVDLKLPERYRHEPGVSFADLPRRTAAFDLGIAPLADIPINRMRSDIKLKEYAAAGAAWLASPVGPFVGHGEAEGGRLVADDGWFEALEELVTDHAKLHSLARNAKAWARRSMIDGVADRWEQVFASALGVEPPGHPPGGELRWTTWPASTAR